MHDRKIDKLIVKTARGDNEAFSELYEGTKRGVYAFLFSYLKHKEDVEDALQTVFLKIKKGAASYREGTNGKAWILQIAKNQALNEIKKRNRTETIEGKDFSAPPVERDGTVNEIMQKVLSNDERQIVVLHVLWGYRHREIAQIINAPIGTVTSKYKRSIAKLKMAIKKEEE